MPTGIYVRTQQCKENLSRAHKGLRNHLGHPHSLGTKLLFSQQRKGKKRTVAQREAQIHKEVMLKYWAGLTPEERKQRAKSFYGTNIGRKQTAKEIEKRMVKIRGIPNPKKAATMIGNKYSLGYKYTTEQRLRASETHRGERSHLWQGGISFEPYTSEFSATIKLKVRVRDKFACQLCQIPENGCSHDIHHIDYDKGNSCKENLITLCHICHTKTNQKRKYWQGILTKIIMRESPSRQMPKQLSFPNDSQEFFNHFHKNETEETEGHIAEEVAIVKEETLQGELFKEVENV